MGPLAAYSIESAILLSILYPAYMLTLRRVKDAALRRGALLGICVLAFLMPLFRHVWTASEDPAVTTEPFTPHVFVIPDDITIPTAYSIAVAIIIFGMCVTSILSLAGLIRILLMRTKTICSNGVRFRIMTGHHPSPFCFCGNIYITEENYRELPEMILAHENSHIAHRHFIDLFIGRISLILQWWNPLAWLLVRELRQVHEYQADCDVIKAGYDCKEYQYLLLSRSTGASPGSFASGFKHRELKNRLKMINREESSRKKAICLLILIPVTLFAIVIPSSSPRFLSETLLAINQVSFKNEKARYKTTVDDGQPYVTVDGVAVSYETLENMINPYAIESVAVRKDHPEQYPNGKIEITSIPGKDIFSKSDRNQDKDVRIVGTGTIKKK